MDCTSPQQGESLSMENYFKDTPWNTPSKLLKHKKDYIYRQSNLKYRPSTIVTDDFFHHVHFEPNRVQGMLIEASIDLHGKTLTQAYTALQTFLEKAQIYKCRWVLVVTGKSGLLYEKVPRWLEEFAPFLHSFKKAPPQQGGKGALIIHIKR